MEKIIEEAMKAVPCAARLGFLCNTPHKFWASCCRLHMAIKCEGQPIQVDYLKDSDEYHILIYKRPNGVRESYGCVSLIEPETTIFCPKCGSDNLHERWNGLECCSGDCTWRSYGNYSLEEKYNSGMKIIEPEWDQDWNIRLAGIQYRNYLQKIGAWKPPAIQDLEEVITEQLEKSQ